jgi:hypothetical protein
MTEASGAIRVQEDHVAVDNSARRDGTSTIDPMGNRRRYTLRFVEALHPGVEDKVIEYVVWSSDDCRCSPR